MNPFFVVSRQIQLPAHGSAVVLLPVSEPYRDYTAWFIGTISATGNVTAQPILTTDLANTNGVQTVVDDGNETILTVASAYFLKLCQQTPGEIRPASQGNWMYPGDTACVPLMVSAVQLTNNTGNAESFGIVLCAVSAQHG